MKYLIIISLFFIGCDHPYFGDINPQPIEQDTVCTTYDEITLPAFIGAYMEADPYQTNVVVNVFPYKDTVQSGEIENALDSMLHLLYPLDTFFIYVNDNDDRLIEIIQKNTNDKNKLLGKLWLGYNGYRHYFGCEQQSLLSCGAMTFDERYNAIQMFPSYQFINHRNTNYDSVQYIKLDEISLDTANCKGCRYWHDFYFRPFQELAAFKNYALTAGCISISHGFGTIVIEGRASDSYILELLDQGYMVKVKE